MDIEEIYNVLNSLAVLIRDGNDNSEKFLTVGKFNDMIFLNDDIIVNDEIDNMLTNLAQELEYYHPDPADKNIPPGFYGDKEFFERVNPVLEKLRAEMERGSCEKP